MDIYGACAAYCVDPFSMINHNEYKIKYEPNSKCIYVYEFDNEKKEYSVRYKCDTRKNEQNSESKKRISISGLFKRKKNRSDENSDIKIKYYCESYGPCIKVFTREKN